MPLKLTFADCSTNDSKAKFDKWLQEYDIATIKKGIEAIDLPHGAYLSSLFPVEFAQEQAIRESFKKKFDQYCEAPENQATLAEAESTRAEASNQLAAQARAREAAAQEQARVAREKEAAAHAKAHRPDIVLSNYRYQQNNDLQFEKWLKSYSAQQIQDAILTIKAYESPMQYPGDEHAQKLALRKEFSDYCHANPSVSNPNLPPEDQRQTAEERFAAELTVNKMYEEISNKTKWQVIAGKSITLTDSNGREQRKAVPNTIALIVAEIDKEKAKGSLADWSKTKEKIDGILQDALNPAKRNFVSNITRKGDTNDFYTKLAKISNPQTAAQATSASNSQAQTTASAQPAKSRPSLSPPAGTTTAATTSDAAERISRETPSSGTSTNNPASDTASSDKIKPGGPAA